MSKRAVTLRTALVLSLGLAALAALLYYASTVDGRAPTVREISLTQHLSADSQMALTTSSVEVGFSEPVDHATAQAAFKIRPATSGSFSWSAAIMTFTPAARLPLSTPFQVSVGPGVRDLAGNRMTANPGPFTFTTVGNPVVVDSNPTDATLDVALDAPIVIDFSTLMDTPSVEQALALTPDLPVRLRWSRERLTIMPVAALEPNQRYSLTIGVGARDQAGTPLERPFQVSFSTVQTGLIAQAIVPADGVAGVAVTTPIAIIFDRPIDPGSVRDNLLTISPSVAGSLDAIAPPGAAGLRDGAVRVLRFQPSAPLDPNTTYQVSLGPGLLGADGAGLPVGVSWSFTTGAPTITLSNQVVFISDRAGVANLWGMNPDGTNQRQLSAELSPVVDYAVAPDGRSFLVADGAAIVLQRADGSARRLLTDADLVEFDPAFSPDGSTITFGRADPAIGGGLGLWTRDADGSDPRPVELPSDPLPTPTPAPATREPLLRAPRISPDGTALAFLDEAGRLLILDLELHHLSAAPFFALSEPIWLSDGSGVLVSGMDAGAGFAPSSYLPRSPVAPLDFAARQLSAGQLSSLHVVRLDRFASSVTPTVFGAGAGRPILDAAGRYAFIRLQGTDATAGSLVVATGLDDVGNQVLRDPGIRVGAASFAPEPGAMLISRVPVATGDPTLSSGIWRVNLASGEAVQLSVDGSLPGWLP